MTTSPGLEAQEGPSESEVRAALERIVASDPFRSSPQLGTFLRFVVDAVLSGRGASLKGYTIAVEALGRDPRFNPQADPIVRVEATRLRRAMERYYATVGSDDPVVIDVARGSYVPTFSRRAALPARAAAPSAPFTARAPPLAALAILGLAVVVLLVAFLLPRRGGEAVKSPAPPAASIATQPTASGLPSGNGMPTISIERLRVAGTPRAGNIAAGPLAEKIRDAFARFDTINVAFGARPADDGASGASVGGAMAQPRADYRLSGSLEYGEAATTILFQLIDVGEGTIAWSRTFEHPVAATDESAAEDQIVVALTDTLLQSYGVIRARDRARQLVSAAGDPRYRCVLEAADSFRSADPVAHDRARSCLEHLTSIDPSFAVGFEFLAAVYYREYALDYGARAGDPPALDRALRAARHAIELAPESARAYQMLFVVQFARREIAAAFADGDRAMALNRYDMLTVAEYGGRLIMVGEVARGMAMLRRAGESGGVRPSWHHFYLFLGSYLGGDMKEAAFQADQITADDYPLGLVAKTITAGAAGNGEQARQAINRLIEVQPAWRDNARRLLEKSIYKPEIVERLLRDLAAAGLPAKS
jgi:TolB-like protein/tetratricopeptide (TPR) repeat protein